MYVKDTIITVSLFTPHLQLSFQARKCKEI